MDDLDHKHTVFCLLIHTLVFPNEKPCPNHMWATTGDDNWWPLDSKLQSPPVKVSHGQVFPVCEGGINPLDSVGSVIACESIYFLSSSRRTWCCRHSRNQEVVAENVLAGRAGFVIHWWKTHPVGFAKEWLAQIRFLYSPTEGVNVNGESRNEPHVGRAGVWICESSRQMNLQQETSLTDPCLHEGHFEDVEILNDQHVFHEQTIDNL